MNKTLLSIGILLLAQLSFAGHHEKSDHDTKTILGYEISEEGEKLDIVAGDASIVDNIQKVTSHSSTTARGDSHEVIFPAAYCEITSLTGSKDLFQT